MLSMPRPESLSPHTSWPGHTTKEDRQRMPEERQSRTQRLGNDFLRGGNQPTLVSHPESFGAGVCDCRHFPFDSEENRRQIAP